LVVANPGDLYFFSHLLLSGYSATNAVTVASSCTVNQRDH